MTITSILIQICFLWVPYHHGDYITCALLYSLIIINIVYFTIIQYKVYLKKCVQDNIVSRLTLWNEKLARSTDNDLIAQSSL